MSSTQFIRRALVAFFSLILVASMAMGQDLNLNGSGGTLGGNWNVKGNINNGSATGTYTFSGTVGVNGTGAQDIGTDDGTPQPLIFTTLNASGGTSKNQRVTTTVNTAFDVSGASSSWVVNAFTLNFAGTTSLTSSGTLDATNASSTVNYTGGSAQTLLGTTYGGTLGLSGAGAKDLGGAVTAAVVSHTAASGALAVDENLTINGTSASSLDQISVTASDILDVTGTGGATIADVTSNAGTIRKTTAAGTITFSQAALTNAGTITASIGSLTFSGDVTNSGGSAVLSLTGTGQANFAQDLINSGGTLTLNNSGTAVNYTGTVDQSVASATYYDLNMSGAGIKNATGNVTIETGGSFDNGTATTDMDTFTLSGPSLTQAGGGTMRFGGATNGVVFSTGTVGYNGGDAVTQTITAGTYANLVLSRKSGTGAAAKEVGSGATVTTTGSLTLPSTTSLTLVDAGSSLNVNGDFNLDGGAITNNGTITVGI
ncbi:MAG: hypothetical protein L0Y80_11280 [Ignavibacteriae bacterium]|nr:hypothetical protein [Ignavibacteriota bacterium]